MSFEPSYKKIPEEDFLRRIHRTEEILKSCTSCPRNCLADRTNGELGTCQSGDEPIVSSYTLHFGEEPVLSGTNGAGNIFFGNCNLSWKICATSKQLGLSINLKIFIVLTLLFHVP